MPVYPGALSFEDKDLYGTVVAMLVYELIGGIWTVKGKVVSDGKGSHAEEELADDLKGDNRLGIAHGASIIIEITKSPCNYHEDGKCCSHLLVELKETGRVSNIEVRYLGIYKNNDYKEMWRSISGMVELEVNNIDTKPWNYKNSLSPSQKIFLEQYVQRNRNKKRKGFWTNVETYSNFPKKTINKNAWRRLNDL